MLHLQASKMRPSSNQALCAALARMTEAEQTALVRSIERLRATLSRFIPFLNNESAEIVTQSQWAVQKMSEEISRVLVVRDACVDRHDLETWESEGGRIEGISQ